MLKLSFSMGGTIQKTLLLAKTNLVKVFLAIAVLYSFSDAFGFGFIGAFWKTVTTSLGTFTITGATGSTDSTADAWLVNDTEPTVVFAASTGATSYDVVIRNDADNTTICSTLGATSTTVAVTSCSLSNNTTYRIKVTAKAGAQTLAASNDGLQFTTDNTTPTTNTIAGIRGASDSTSDAWLVGGLVPNVYWNAFTNASTYDVIIKDSAGSSTVCALQNTSSTNYNFASCTLDNNTDYRAYVTAKSPSGFNTVAASNDGYLFSVDNNTPGAFSITGITGGSDVVVDAYLADGDDPSVNYGSSSNAYRYDVVIKDSTGTTTQCSTSNSTGSATAVSCSLSNGVTYKAYVTAKSVSGFTTTVASNDGYSFNVSAPVAGPPSDFLITGATGGTDTTADSWLTNGTNVTANWNAAYGATSYDVTIRNSADSSDVCATQNTASTTYAFSSCTLTAGTIYLIKVVAKNGSSTNALNNGYAFTVLGTSPASFILSGITGGSDSTSDGFLMSGTTATVNWTASTNATSYDVTIRNAADTADVCATQNTTSTSYNFSSCTLTAGTYYNARVVAKNGTITKDATRSPSKFYLPLTVNFCPTGSSTAPAIIMYDSGGSGGNYGNSENCNFTFSPNTSMPVMTFTSVGLANNDRLTVYDGTSTGGTLKVQVENTTTNPTVQTASSGSFYLTFVSSASGVSTGYAFSIIAAGALPGSFSITGISGGSDSTADAYLTDNSSGVTVAWGTSSGSPNYYVAIRDSNDLNDLCTGTTTSTSLNFPSCTLVEGATYKVTVRAHSSISGTQSTNASNGPYSFTYTRKPFAFNVTGVTGGTDSTADNYLENGNNATINWTASTGATSYDITIFESDGYTVKCALTNVAAPATSYAFSSCALTTDSNYKAEVVAKNTYGSTLASNGFLVLGIYPPWSAMAATSLGDRDNQAMVWTGSEVIVWGGQWFTTYHQDGAKYNPTTDSWTAMTTTDAPSGRRYMSYVWTDTEMIVWGGDNNNVRTNTGGRYNPSTNDWEPTSTGTDVPDARNKHTAVWTGTEMIVFGGNNGTTQLGSGAKYSPSGDSWVPTANDGFEVAVEEHTAVWTGSLMVIWGGKTGASSYNNDGRSYNPSGDSWSLLGGSSSLSGRTGHAAVWTGTEMIVWGGWNGSTKYNDGAKYKPSTFSWSSISSTSAPVARYNASRVWTGSTMIVWGGITSTVTNTGGIYDYATNTWTATSLTGDVPSGRQGPPGIWTGSMMVIWGQGVANGSVYRVPQ